jgi:hypothetical protein
VARAGVQQQPPPPPPPPPSLQVFGDVGGATASHSHGHSELMPAVRAAGSLRAPALAKQRLTIIS